MTTRIITGAVLAVLAIVIVVHGGLLFFGERQGLKKLPSVIGVLIGIALTLLG